MPGMLPDKNDKTIKNRYMQNKLQELTDKLYNEGLSKGKQEGEAVLAKARQDAGAIIENARKEAAAIIAAAQKDADSLKARGYQAGRVTEHCSDKAGAREPGHSQTGRQGGIIHPFLRSIRKGNAYRNRHVFQRIR